MNILSIDIGIKHLAHCLLHLENNKVKYVVKKHPMNVLKVVIVKFIYANNLIV